ncbi:MAG: hypothetical protein INR64_11935 [Caulobacteraceae bacterium]|nr:hypothetical protein [Caulobacter sp.]
MRLRTPLPALALAASVVAAGAARAAPVAPWSGVYTYSLAAGRNAGGDGMVVDYRLSLMHGGCRLSASGYQTDETILCTAVPVGDRLDVRFRSYGDGKLTDPHGVAGYRPGQSLFALEHRGAATITRWGAYQLLDDKPRPPAVYFVRRR